MLIKTLIYLFNFFLAALFFHNL